MLPFSIRSIPSSGYRSAAALLLIPLLSLPGRLFADTPGEQVSATTREASPAPESGQAAAAVFPPAWRAGAWLNDGNVAYLREAIAPLTSGTSYLFTTLGYSLSTKKGRLTPSLSLELPLVGMASYDGMGVSGGVGNLLIQGAVRKDRAFRTVTLTSAVALGLSLPVGGWTGTETHAVFIDPTLTHPNLPASSHWDYLESPGTRDTASGLVHIPLTAQVRLAGAKQAVGLELKIPFYRTDALLPSIVEVFNLSLEYQRRLNDTLYLQTSLTLESLYLGHLNVGLWHRISRELSASVGVNVPCILDGPKEIQLGAAVPVQPVFGLWYRPAAKSSRG